MKQKSDNRKALPKFVLIMIGSLLLGAVIGVAIVFADGDWTYSLSAYITQFLIAAAPWLIYGTAILAAAAVFILLRKSKKQYAAMTDPDDEDTVMKIDHQLNIALLISNISSILSYFLVGIPFCYGFSMDGGWFFGCLLGFALCMVVCTISQQKIVDFVKQLYPEKRGSVYDTNFQKTWYESCDEAERAMIGQAAYASTKATSIGCILLWGVLVIGNLLFDIGLLPIAVVTIIWLIGSVSYQRKCIQLEQRAKKM